MNTRIPIAIGIDELWIEFGRQALEGSIGETGNDRRKKKQLSRFGKIEISKKNEWSENINGFGITPYMQDIMLYSGQDDN